MPLSPNLLRPPFFLTELKLFHYWDSPSSTHFLAKLLAPATKSVIFWLEQEHQKKHYRRPPLSFLAFTNSQPFSRLVELDIDICDPQHTICAI